MLFRSPVTAFLRMFYHQILIALLVAATFIDADYYIIPDSITVTGMVVGLLLGTLDPGVRMEPATASTALAGFVAGIKGLLIGGGIIWLIRILGSLDTEEFAHPDVRSAARHGRRALREPR